MSPEFKKWCDQFDDIKRSRLSGSEFIVALEAWLEATRQAYEDAARICEEERILSDNELDVGYNIAIDDCVEAIRAKAKEYE